VEAILEAAPVTVLLRAGVREKEVTDSRELEGKRTGTKTG
jgi:hypothetical protein